MAGFGEREAEALKGLLLGTDEQYDHPYIKLRAIPDGFEIDYGRMYEAPTLALKDLKAISEFFGTDDIDVDNYGHRGCETCDWGSQYGHTIQVKGASQHVPEFKKGKDLVILSGGN